MTFLELVKLTWRTCGLSGSGPASVTDQTDMHARIVQYVQDAYQFIQQQHDCWKFHWVVVTGQTLTAGQPTHQWGDFGIANLRTVDRFLLEDADGRLTPLTEERDPARFKDFDNLLAGRPTRFLLRDDGAIVFDAIPDAAYPARIEYFRQAHALTLNTDSPLIPEEYQRTIVYKALEYYSWYDEDAAMNMQAAREFGSSLHRLQRNQLPELRFGRAVLL